MKCVSFKCRGCDWVVGWGVVISAFIIMFNMCVCRLSAGGVVWVVGWGVVINDFGIHYNDMRVGLPPRGMIASKVKGPCRANCFS